MSPADPRAPDPPPWTRAEVLASALFALALLASLAATAHPWYDLRSSDSGLYLATARSLAAGEGYTHLGMPFANRPPGFSLLLAPVVAWRGLDFRALNLWVGCFGVAGAVLLALLARPRLGTPLALLTALAVWLAPGYQQLCNQLLSDVPGAAFVLACLLLERWASRAPSWRRELALGGAIAAAASVRSAALLLVPAIAAARALAWWRAGAARPPAAVFGVRRIALFAAVTALLLLPWGLYARAVRPPPPVDQTGVYSYATAFWHEDPADPRSPRLGPAALLERVPTRALQIAGALGSRLQTPVPAPGRGALAALAVAALLAAALRRREPAELFALASLALLLLYFDLRPRLLLPVALIALPAAVEGLRDLVARFAPRRVAAGSAAGALVLAIALDFAPRSDWPEIEEKHEAFLALCKAVDWALAPDARVATAFNWHYAACLDRPVYSLLFAVRRSGDMTAAEAVIDKYGIDTVVLTPFWVLDQALYPYFEQRYGVQKHVDRAFLFRVRP